MPRINECEIIKPILPIVFVVESSDIMAGERLTTINEVVRESHNLLLEVASNHPDVEVKIAVIKYGDSAELVTDGFEYISRFDWIDIDACGKANLGKAIELLDTKLLQKKVIKGDDIMAGHCMPIVVYFASSLSADDYLTPLSNADKNKNYRMARKVCVAIGDEADKNMLAKIAGNCEAVIRPNDLEVLKNLFVVVDIQDGRMPEDVDSQSSLLNEVSSIVKVDGIENRDNFYLEGAYGSSVSVIGSIDVARCQCGPCEPEAANDVMFHIDDAKGYLKLTNSENIDDLYVSFYVGAKHERTIVGCCKTIFAINSVSGDRLDSSVIFELEENGIKISNGSSGAIYLKAIIDAGMCTHLLNNDIIQNANDNLLTVRSNKVEEIISGLMGDIEPTSIDPIDGDLGGWDDDSDWS